MSPAFYVSGMAALVAVVVSSLLLSVVLAKSRIREGSRFAISMALGVPSLVTTWVLIAKLNPAYQWLFLIVPLVVIGFWGLVVLEGRRNDYGEEEWGWKE